MRPLLGDLLARAGEHIDAVTGFDGPLPEPAARAAVQELDRIAATMTRCAGGFRRYDESDSIHLLDEQARFALEARSALAEAAAGMRAAARGLGGGGDDRSHPAVAHLADAVGCLAAGHDLLQTHFTPSRAGVRAGNSPWAPLIVSAPVGTALAAEMAGYGGRLAPWAIRLTALDDAGAAALPAPARSAVISACRWLRVAETAAWAAAAQRPAAAGRALLHAVPANTPPLRRPPRDGEQVPALCAGIAVTAERLGHLAYAGTAPGVGDVAAVS
jgi:hypothetical protein